MVSQFVSVFRAWVFRNAAAREVVRDHGAISHRKPHGARIPRHTREGLEDHGGSRGGEVRGLSVVIPSKTASNLIPCVEAVRKHEPEARIIVVDDGLDLSAADAEAEDNDWHCWLCDMDPSLLIAGVKPFNFSRNMNLGIKAAGADDVVLLNDDALLQVKAGFSAMQRAAEEHPEYGIISATTNVAGNPDQFPKGIGLRDAGDKCVAFVCVLIPRRTIEAVGLLDERFTTYGWQDNDFCHRVRLAGLKVGIHDGCYVDHGSLVSTYRGGAAAAGDIEPGRRIFEAKWGTA